MCLNVCDIETELRGLRTGWAVGPQKDESPIFEGWNFNFGNAAVTFDRPIYGTQGS